MAFVDSHGKSRISQGVEHWGSLISVPLALRVFFNLCPFGIAVGLSSVFKIPCGGCHSRGSTFGRGCSESRNARVGLQAPSLLRDAFGDEITEVLPRESMATPAEDQAREQEESNRERERERERDTERERDRERERDTERERDRERKREDMERERERYI